MRKLILIIGLSWIIPAFVIGANARGNHNKKDTITLKCILFSANLFYGCELGEKPVCDMVDTLVSEIRDYDSSSKLQLVVVSLKDLGFAGWKNIPWNDILDSAAKHGYKPCLPQVGPEIIVMSQMVHHAQPLLPTDMSDNKPIYIGMKKIKHVPIRNNTGTISGLRSDNSFEYIFCIKGTHKKGEYMLGYCATDFDKHIYSWTDKDRFIFALPIPNDRSKKYCGN